MPDEEYIERERLLDFLQNTYDIPLDTWMARDYWTKVAEIKHKFISCIEKLPADDVVEVRHGAWKLGKSGVVYFCPECGYCATPREAREWKYCPVCGMIMDGDKHDGK